MATTLKGKQEQAEAIERLRGWIKPGDTLYTILRHVSASGMTRVISVKQISPNQSGSGVSDLSWNIAVALGEPYDRDREGVRVGGAGMDMGFHLVYNVGLVLWPDGFDCIGDHCRANDHSNAGRGTCPICGKTVEDGIPFTRKNRGWDIPVCSLDCAEATWHHNDGGYALRHSWL